EATSPPIAKLPPPPRRATPAKTDDCLRCRGAPTNASGLGYARQRLPDCPSCRRRRSRHNAANTGRAHPPTTRPRSRFARPPAVPPEPAPSTTTSVTAAKEARDRRRLDGELAIHILQFAFSNSFHARLQIAIANLDSIGEHLRLFINDYLSLPHFHFI